MLAPMADVSLIQQLMDPVSAPPAPGALWPVLAGGTLFTLAGAWLIQRVIRGLGPPTGNLPLRMTAPALALAVAMFVCPVMVGRVFQETQNFEMALGVAQVVVALVCVALLARLQAAGVDAPPVGWVRASPRVLGRTLVVWIFLTPTLTACILASVAAVMLAGGEVGQQPTMERLAEVSDMRGVASWYVLAGLAAPLAEEFIFRLVLFGLVAGWFARSERWTDPGRLLALAVSGSLFIAAHGWWVVGFVPLAFLAWVLTALFAHSRSIWPPVLLHALHNTLVLTIQFSGALQA